MTALHDLTISEASARIRAGELSPVDLVEACLARIAAREATLHAFITVTADAAREAARFAAADIRAGRWRGPLHGIPIAHKDLVATRGVRTTAHSNRLRDWVPDHDAAVVTRLAQAGAISLGKLSLWEFAFGNPGPGVAFPPARNPWNADFSPGGSSSGSGAALAARMVFGATGTDTGGSIRHPAAVCGIVGMKPTWGRVSLRGVLPLATSMDHVGPMTRTVRDNALMLQAMAGHDPQDPHSADEPVPAFDRLIGSPIRGMRIGVPRRFLASLPHTPDCAAAFDDALRVLRDRGAETIDIDVPGLAESGDIGMRIIIAEAWAVHREGMTAHPELYDVSLKTRLAPAPAITEAALAEAHAARRALQAEYAKLFAAGIDVIASTGREGESDSMAELMSDTTGKRGGCTRMYNVARLPALVLPMGFGPRRLPLGLQLAAAPWREDQVYRVAAAYEDATRWPACAAP